MHNNSDLYALEKAHTPNDDPFWQESWYFNFSDPVNDVYGLVRIAYRPHTGRADGLLLASIKGKPAVLYPAVGLKMSSPQISIQTPKKLQTKGLSLSCQAPMKSWKICLKTRQVDLEIVFESFTSMYMFPEVATQDGKSAAASHYEQAGRVQGYLSCNGKSIPIDGLGQRDHSWGPRHWAGVESWNWISAQFPSGWAFNHWSLGSGPPSKTCGFVGNRENNQDLVKGNIQWKENPGRQGLSGADMQLTLADGSIKEIFFTSKAPWSLYKDGAIIDENFGAFTCDGEPGVGVVERLHAPRLAMLKYLPQVPVMIAAGLKSL